MTRVVNVYKKRVFSIIKQIYKQVDVVFMEHDLNLSHQKFGTNSYFKSVLNCVDYVQYQLKQQAIHNRALCVQTPRNFSSSHTCFNCGSYNIFRGCSSSNLDVRSFVCTRCGAKHDRDINATINIEREGVKSLRFCIEFGRYPKRSEFATGSSNWRTMR